MCHGSDNDNIGAGSAHAIVNVAYERRREQRDGRRVGNTARPQIRALRRVYRRRGRRVGASSHVVGTYFHLRQNGGMRTGRHEKRACLRHGIGAVCRRINRDGSGDACRGGVGDNGAHDAHAAGVWRDVMLHDPNACGVRPGKTVHAVYYRCAVWRGKCECQFHVRGAHDKNAFAGRGEGVMHALWGCG